MIDDDLAPPVADLGLADTPGDSRIQWLDGSDKVPVEVAATGPRVIGIAARHAERVMFTLGADPERLQWGIETARKAAAEAGRNPDDLRFGAYVNVGCHENRETARSLVRGGLTTFARFSVMHGDIAGPMDEAQTQVLNQPHDQYDMNKHTRGDSRQAEILTPDFIDRYAIVGAPEEVLERIQALADLGLDKLAVAGPVVSARQPEAVEAITLLRERVLPEFVS